MRNKNCLTEKKEELILKIQQALCFISFYTNAKDIFSYFVFIYVCFDLKYKKMLLYLCFFNFVFMFCMGEKKLFERSVFLKKMHPYVYTGYLFVFCVAISLDLFYSSDASAYYKFYLGICILFVHISFLIFYRLFQNFQY